MPHEQNWDPKQYERDAGFVAELGAPVVELLAPRSGERILDIGCGDGRLTEKLVAAGCEVVAVDASPEQVAAARDRALDAHVVDARKLEFDGEFDAVFTNAALHWIKPPEEVLTGVARALKPGGRFVGEFGGRGNVASVRHAIEFVFAERCLNSLPLDPWFFPSEAKYGRLLDWAGFDVESIVRFPRPTPIPTDVIGWLEMFGEPFTNALLEEDRRPFLERVRDLLRPELTDDEGNWTMDYVRLRFRAVLR